MPFVRPSLTTLRQNIMNDFAAAGYKLLPRSVLYVIATAQAGLAALHYQYLDWISAQSIPFTAQQEYLEAWAALKGVYREDATASAGSIVFAGNVGTNIPAGTNLSRADGFTYATASDGAVGDTIPFKATASGSAGNVPVNTVLSLTLGITGVSQTAPVAIAAIGGADQETDDSLRTRMLFQYSNPPQGGALSDYIEWAEAIPGVTRAWALANGQGAGTVVLWIMLDISNAGTGGFPVGNGGVAAAEKRIIGFTATGDCLNVANTLFAKQPATSMVFVEPPNKFSINFTVSGIVPNNPLITAQIRLALADMLTRVGSPIPTVDPDADPALGPPAPFSYVFPSDVSAALESVAGLRRFTILSPINPVPVPQGSLPVLGTVTLT